jgi:hypothetical protein
MEGWFHVKRVPLTWSHNALRAEVLFAPAWCILGVLSATLPLPDYGRVARNSTRIDATRGDHFLQADLVDDSYGSFA